MLNLTERQLMDPTLEVPVRASPSVSAPVVASAGAVVVVRDAEAPINGFVQMLTPDARQAWIAASVLRPYRSESNPAARCVPEVLPNGRIGFGSPN
jgi:hypothetical protein